MIDEFEELELLEGLGRLRNHEKGHLGEYRRLREKILVLPGFEFTATLGFHVLGIFPPDKDVRELEFILRRLNVPADQLDSGSTEVGATSDVLTAYRIIADEGGLAIAAHVNSSHGVAMRGLGIGGQTRIAYTQDANLLALEVTDLDKRGRRTTSSFFDGSRPEYPRRMHCIQGSDSHRLNPDSKDKQHLGLGERVTEVLMPEVSFEALKTVLQSNDFSCTRPYHAAKAPVDFIRAAREEGPSIVQDFHASYTRRGGHLYAILSDVCAFANTNGGTIYVGVSADAKEAPSGVSAPTRVLKELQAQVGRRVTPPLEVAIDVRETGGVKVLRVVVPRGSDPPYAIDDNKIYVRSEVETGPAVRDEIVNLARRAHAGPAPMPAGPAPTHAGPAPMPAGPTPMPAGPALGHVEPPRTGVEIVETEERTGTRYHTMRDLRNGNVIKNVTRESARKLWHYAITQAEEHPVDAAGIKWQGDIGLLKRRKLARRSRYDLVQRSDGKLRVYYGVTDDGIHSEWTQLVGLE